MKLSAPTINIDEHATDQLIESTIKSLAGECEPFAILSKEEMNYVQTLWTDDGFIVSFQNGSIDEHYEFNTFLSGPQKIDLFQAYLANNEAWQGNLQYSKKNISGFLFRLGLSLGRFWGNTVRGFNETRSK